MSLYGLDFLIDKKGKLFLGEINGINLGMKGFYQLYGDDRVRDTAVSMLKARYGKLTFNTGEYTRDLAWEHFPLRFALQHAFLNVEPTRSALIGMQRTTWPLSTIDSYAYLSSSSARYLRAKLPAFEIEHPSRAGAVHPHLDGIEVYRGQESTVINALNERLPHPLVNSYVAEELAEHKFFQIMILQNKGLDDVLIPTMLYGLGWTDPDAWRRMRVRTHNGARYVVKPLCGSQGDGVVILGQDSVARLMERNGCITDALAGSSTLGRLLASMERKQRSEGPIYLEDLAAGNDYTFEQGLVVIQPFVNTRRSGTKEFCSIRAVVCNGQFVDAYVRTDKTEVVNLARGALPKRCTDSRIRGLSEDIVEAFEDVAIGMDPKTFRKDLYQEYFAKRSRRQVHSSGNCLTEMVQIIAGHVTAGLPI